MYFKTSYDEKFDDLYMHLKAKYPDKLFDLDGIGKQLDMNSFSREFFSAETITADASIDGNANVDDSSIIAYGTELPKPFFRLNSYYVLWKECAQLYGLERANEIIEMNLNGDIYINDFHGIGAGLPYSYYKKTVLSVKIGEELIYTTFEDLYNILKKDNEEIVYEDSKQIYLKNVSILDKDNKWVNVSRILKHKSHTDLVKIETKNGMCTIVTKDHPIIMNDKMEEKKAEDITLSDTLLCSNSKLVFTEEKEVSTDFAYRVGLLTGDCEIENLNNIELNKIGKKLPIDILTWEKEAIKALISGVIDSYGSIESDGSISIKTISFDFIQQLSEILRGLNCGIVKSSFCEKSQSKLDLYECSIKLEDKTFINYSKKIQNNIDMVYKEADKEGRFETNKIHKIIEIDTDEYVYDITTDSGHFHCQGLIQHNCFNYSTLDIHLKGLPMVKKIKSTSPKYLYSFKSQLEQFTVIASNSTLGATGLADLLVVMSYYVKNILKTKRDAHFTFNSDEDIWNYVGENITSFIYTINQPMRGNQSPFTNVSIYDDNFLETMCEDYIFIDGTSPDKEIIKKLQVLYLNIMNSELKRTPVTFPVTTACFSIDKNKEILDNDFLEFISEQNKEFGFINIYCGDSSTLSSCCRLRSDKKNEYFNSFGSGSSKIGSLGVCTINFPRMAIKHKDHDSFIKSLEYMVQICAEVNNAKRKIIEKRIKNGNEPLYTLGFMDISKQYSTCGVCGFNECIEWLGEDILTEDGQSLAIKILDTINSTNDIMQKSFNTPHNCEQIPAEGTAAKLAKKDKLLGYQTTCNLYSNQFIPLTTKADMLDRIRLQGMFDGHFSGGAICHLNIDQEVDKWEDIADLIKMTAKKGVVYFAINYVLCECEKGHMTVGNGDKCSICGELIINKYTRVVGFLTNVKNWIKVRREEDFPNREFYEGIK